MASRWGPTAEFRRSPRRSGGGLSSGRVGEALLEVVESKRCQEPKTVFFHQSARNRFPTPYLPDLLFRMSTTSALTRSVGIIR